MTKAEMKQIIEDCCNDVLFTYNGKNAGITSEVKNYVPTFQAWSGSSTKKYTNVDDVMADKFFGEKSIIELLGEVEFTFA